MRRALLLVVLLAGCGAPQELPKQAEEVASVAAEGSLLAHEVAEGSSTDAFTREHAEALRRRLEELRPAIEDVDLATLADKVAAVLTALAEQPGDRERAATLERVFESHAKAAEELAA